MSTDDQDLRLQRAALKEAGCKRTFEERISGAKRDRPQLAKMIEQLRDEDTVVVTRLDRLAAATLGSRSLPTTAYSRLSEFVRTLQHRQGIQIACLEEIAFEQGFITVDQARARGEMFKKTAYGRAILNAIDGR